MASAVRLRWLRACGEFAGVLVLCLLPYPGLDHAYADAFAGVANWLGAEQRLASGLVTHLEPARSSDLGGTRAKLGWHVMYSVENPANGRETRLGFNTRSSSYLPLCAFLAALLALRVWRRPHALRAAALGLALVVGYSALALVLSSARFLAQPRVAGLALGPTARALLDALFMAWIVPPGMAYAAPLLATLVVLWISRGRPLFVAPAEAGAKLRRKRAADAA